MRRLKTAAACVDAASNLVGAAAQFLEGDVVGKGCALPKKTGPPRRPRTGRPWSGKGPPTPDPAPGPRYSTGYPYRIMPNN